jgi:hypothetical protein
MRWEAPPLQEVKDVLPTNRVKSLVNVKLEEEGRSLSLVEPSGKIFDIQEIFVDAFYFMKAL